MLISFLMGRIPWSKMVEEEVLIVTGERYKRVIRRHKKMI
jgi:hypothetical protein